MKAYVCQAFGTHGPGELPEPVAGEGEVLIRVFAAGVNFYDTLMVQGRYQVKPPVPFAPGGEVAGVVEGVGGGVEGIRPGDRVMAFTSWGGYAQKVVAKAAWTWPLPAAVDFDTAAAGLVTCGTAWLALHELARVQRGETMLVLGAAGGVGLAAIQIARRAGARVIAVAGGAERLQHCFAAGADEGIGYDNLREAVKGLTDGHGADVVLDVVGGPHTEQALRAMAWRGRLLVIGFATGEIPRIPTNLVLLKGCRIEGVFWDEFLRREPERGRAHLAAITAAWAEGGLKPPVSARYPLERAGEALAALAERRAAGKLLVIPPAP